MSERKKLAIISSYNELCGNATYTEALRKAFSRSYDTEILPLDVKLLKESHKAIQKLADDSIKQMGEKLRQFDYVNIQFEAGLFGTFSKQIVNRFKVLAKNAKNLVVTLHRYDPETSVFQKNILKDIVLFSFGKALKKIMNNMKQRYFAKMYKKIIHICIEQEAKIIVHTKRDQFLISKTFHYEKVYDHPITFLMPEEIEQYRSQVNRTDFLKKYGLEKEDITIGIFGFIAAYKGCHTLFNALRFLPPEYKLLVFGAQHPGDIRQNERLDPYLNELLDLIEKDIQSGESHLKERIKFAGSLNDDEFIKAIMSVDINVLPYLETNQGGSGIAALTLEAKAHAIFSANYSFMELARYAPNCFQMISIGNYMELAECIKNYNNEKDKEKTRTALENYTKQYNLQSNILLYKNLFEENA